jgi:hypothetical protein
MKLSRRKFLHLAAGAAAPPATPCIALAQAHPIEVGVNHRRDYHCSGSDIIARIMGENQCQA